MVSTELLQTATLQLPGSGGGNFYSGTGFASNSLLRQATTGLRSENAFGGAGWQPNGPGFGSYRSPTHPNGERFDTFSGNTRLTTTNSIFGVSPSVGGVVSTAPSVHWGPSSTEATNSGLISRHTFKTGPQGNWFT